MAIVVDVEIENGKVVNIVTGYNELVTVVEFNDTGSVEVWKGDEKVFEVEG